MWGGQSYKSRNKTDTHEREPEAHNEAQLNAATLHGERITVKNEITDGIEITNAFHAIKLSTPPEAILQVLPIVISIKLPVPFVHFIVPASRQPCAKRDRF